MEEELSRIQFIDIVQTAVIASLAIGAFIQMKRIQTVEKFLARFHFRKGRKE